MKGNALSAVVSGADAARECKCDVAGRRPAAGDVTGAGNGRGRHHSYGYILSLEESVRRSVG